MEEHLDLYQLQQLLKEGLEDQFPGRVWVKAEISSVQVRTNGHCYLELCQAGRNGVIAKARAVIWRSSYTVLSRCFRETTGDDLKAGMSLLMQVQVSYSELYGLTLVVYDLDASFTLGEAEARRRETVRKLEEDGLIDAQKSLELARLPYRLAVISAVDAAGYGDFCRHLLENEYGFRYEVELFPATMQGDGAPASIIDALAAVECSEQPYDAALILRGGGSSLDLACFDDYGLCFAIANCSVPVITAIGHDRDYHAADMVAFEHVKTPTALADLFIDCYIAEDERLAGFSLRLRVAFLNRVSAMSQRLDLQLSRLKLALSGRVSREEQVLAALATRISSADPRRLMQSGYAVATGPRGEVLKSSSAVSEGDRIELRFSDGIIDCEVLGVRGK